MNITRNPSITITCLKWTLGLVVLLESIHFALSPLTAHHLAAMGLPPWVRFALGGGEVAAAMLFLVPQAMKLGGWLLLVIFAFAVAIHLLNGQIAVGALLVYAAAVIVCMTNPKSGSAAA